MRLPTKDRKFVFIVIRSGRFENISASGIWENSFVQIPEGFLRLHLEAPEDGLQKEILNSYACVAHCGPTLTRNLTALPPYAEAASKRSQAFLNSTIAAPANLASGLRVGIEDSITCHTAQFINTTSYQILEKLTAPENACVQRTQKRAICAGNKSNCARTRVMMVHALRYPARNEGAYWLFSGSVGWDVIAWRKKMRWTYNNAFVGRAQLH